MAINVRYSVAIESATGELIVETSQIVALEWERHENKITWLGVELAPNIIAANRDQILQRHNRIRVYRSVNGGPFVLVGRTLWHLLAWNVTRKGVGSRVILRAACANWILGNERQGVIVAYKAGDAKASTTAEVDVAAKTLVLEHLGAGATDYDSTDRDRSAYLTIDDALPSGSTPAISKSFSMQPLRRVLDALAAYSAENGTTWLYDVEATGGKKLHFTTYVGQSGADRDLTFSFDNGNISDFEFTETYIDEVTAVYIGGAGQGAARVFRNGQSDAAGETPFGRRERMRSYPRLSVTASLEDAVEHELFIGGGRKFVTVTVEQAPGAVYGVDWEWGDRCRWYDSYTGLTGRDRIAGVRVSFDSTGETVSARLFSGLPTANAYASIDESEIEI